jgi:hypothetical protein
MTMPSVRGIALLAPPPPAEYSQGAAMEEETDAPAASSDW